MCPRHLVHRRKVASGDWGIAGNPLHSADVKAFAAGIASPGKP
jgi:hypothetical protein